MLVSYSTTHAPVILGIELTKRYILLVSEEKAPQRTLRQGKTCVHLALIVVSGRDVT